MKCKLSDFWPVGPDNDVLIQGVVTGVIKNIIK